MVVLVDDEKEKEPEGICLEKAKKLTTYRILDLMCFLLFKINSFWCPYLFTVNKYYLLQGSTEFIELRT